MDIEKDYLLKALEIANKRVEELEDSVLSLISAIRCREDFIKKLLNEESKK